MKSYEANEQLAIEQKFAIERKLSGEFAVSKKSEIDESAFGNEKLSPGEDDSFCNTKQFLTLFRWSQYYSTSLVFTNTNFIDNTCFERIE